MVRTFSSNPNPAPRILVIDDNRAIHDDFNKILGPASVKDDAISAFEESLAREGLKSRLHMTYTIMGFPEEVTGEEAYLDKVCGQDGGAA